MQIESLEEHSQWLQILSAQIYKLPLNKTPKPGGRKENREIFMNITTFEETILRINCSCNVSL